MICLLIEFVVKRRYLLVVGSKAIKRARFMAVAKAR